MLNIGSGFIKRRNGRLRKLVQKKYGSVTKENPHERDGSFHGNVKKGDNFANSGSTAFVSTPFSSSD